MDKMYRGDKLYLDKEQKKESEINWFLNCRDGVVKMFEYTTVCWQKERLFCCENSKQDAFCIIRHTYREDKEEWREECMHFDIDTFRLLKSLVNGETEGNGDYFSIRDFREEE